MERIEIKKIGLLTSGGDCAGLNTAIRAITLRAVNGYGWEVWGILHGTHGLLGSSPCLMKLTPHILHPGLSRMGGTILGTTNKGNPFSFPMSDGSYQDRSQEFAHNFHHQGLDALIGIGGDGSLSILHHLTQKGHIPFVGIPKTIDNDLGNTENAIGFLTAVEVATEALDRLQPTAASHDRVMILQVMGRDAGHIALHAGIAGGADIILIPEIPYKLEGIYKKIRTIYASGRNYALVIIAEAVKTPEGQGDKFVGHVLGEHISRATDSETRVTILGHVQRGGEPIAQDRVLASALGVHAVDLISQGKFSRMVAWQNRQIIDVPIEEAIECYHSVDVQGALVKTARSLGICFGDNAEV